MLFFQTISTRFGELSVIWKNKGKSISIQRIFLSNSLNSASEQQKIKFPTDQRGNHSIISRLIDKINNFFDGNREDFSLEILDFSVCPPFQKLVITTEATIPYGKVSTYKQIALQLEKPTASRAVANALANNPFPIIIPCHRTIRSDGSISGYQGGNKMKQELLNMEGVEVNSQLKVNLSEYCFYFN